jgi:hypothetical protein
LLSLLLPLHAASKTAAATAAAEVETRAMPCEIGVRVLRAMTVPPAEAA